MPRAESDIVKDAAVLPESDLAFGAAIQIIEDGLRNASARKGAKIFNTYGSRSYP